MNNIAQFAMHILSKNPRVANNPQAKELLNVISSGDAKRGEEIATNICNTYGVSKEEAIKKASSYFNFPM